MVPQKEQFRPEREFSINNVHFMFPFVETLD